MLISEFDYPLPENLIAQEPLADRAASRMLIVDRSSGSFRDENFSELPTFLGANDLLVLNNTKVFPARLHGRSETGSKIEIFLLREIQADVWETLARPGRRLRSGKRILFGDELSAEVVEKSPDGKVVVRFATDGELYPVLDRIGKTPLPPYIHRDRSALDGDRERYQTVFSKERGAIAAPTAGLHFTQEVLGSIKERGTQVVEITLHVGYGTFEPVREAELEKHSVMAERYEISNEAAELLNRARSAKRRIVAVGTTSTRALESNLYQHSRFKAGRFMAALTILPDYSFKAIDALLTNFHLPMSSLLVLTSTFGGHELIMNAYRHAVGARYRFYSYGDCMLII